MVEVSLTVGKLDASLALLLTKDHHLIEFPSVLLPQGVKAGSIVKIKCDRDIETEVEEQRQFQAIQDEIIDTFGKNLPQIPKLRVKNVTQTSIVLEWDKLDLGTATLKNLVLFKDSQKAGSIPQPLANQTTKLSGLTVGTSHKFFLRLDTTAGVFDSEPVEVTTHKMTDLSGITVCLGDITPNDQFTVDDIEAALKNMGAHYPPQDKVKVDTTHFITTRENKLNPEFIKANEMNIPIIRPEWLKACERERRIIGVRDFYVKDCALPLIFAANYWQKPTLQKPQKPELTEQSELAEKSEQKSEQPEQKSEQPEQTESSSNQLSQDAPSVQITSPSPDRRSSQEKAAEEGTEPKTEPASEEPKEEPEVKPEEPKTEEPTTEEPTTEESKPEEEADGTPATDLGSAAPEEDVDLSEKPPVPEKDAVNGEGTEKSEPEAKSEDLEKPGPDGELEDVNLDDKPEEKPEEKSEAAEPEKPEEKTENADTQNENEGSNDDDEDEENSQQQNQGGNEQKSLGNKKSNKKKKNKKRK